ncbi:MAG: hypothetical protein U5N55_07950 [Cypionkella sp.]|nr:hypothetical protein [Cypionkella sp.]
MMNVIVYGEKGCGKTFYAEKLRVFFGCDDIVDEWLPGDPLVLGHLHLTFEHVHRNHDPRFQSCRFS